MLLSARRAFAPLLATAIVASALVAGAVAPEAAMASTAKPTPYPLGHKLADLSSAAQMVEADHKLFVSSGVSGSSVQVYSTSGTHLKSIGGQPGAEGMVVSPDGSTVYVADANSDKIVAINASTLAATKAYEGTSCPESLAFAAGRLFFGYGCDAPNAGGVASIDLTTSDPAVVALSGMYGPPMVRGTGSYLVATDGQDDVSSYSVDSTGATTLLSTFRNDDVNPADMAISANGKYVDVASGAPYNVYSYSIATLSQHLVYPGTAYPQAVAVDPTGTYVAGGFESYDMTARLYGANSTTVKWERYTAQASATAWSNEQDFDHMLPQTMTFSPDGSDVFGLVTQENLDGVYLFSSVVSPKASTLAGHVPNVGAGRRHTIIGRVDAPKGTTVSFESSANGKTKKLGTATTDSHGIVRKSFASKWSGTVTMTMRGSAALLPSSKTISFSAKSKTKVHFTGSRYVEHGMTTYSSWKSFGLIFTTTPAEYQRANTFEVQRREDGVWVIEKRYAGYSGQAGAHVYWATQPAPGEYRVKLSVRTDAFSRGSTATSKPFRMT